MHKQLPSNTDSVLSRGCCSVHVWGTINLESLNQLAQANALFIGVRYYEIFSGHCIPYVLAGPFLDGCYIFQHHCSPINKARTVSALLECYAMCQLLWLPSRLIFI